MTDDGRVEPTARPRLLILASTFPRSDGDGTPAFVADLARHEAAVFETLVLVPRVGGAPLAETKDGYEVRRFRYFPSRWENVADGAILENVRTKRIRSLQVPALLLAEIVALRRAMRDFKPDILHVHWIVPQGLAALVVARSRPWLVTTLGGDLYALTARPWLMAKRAVLRRAAAVTVMNVDMADRVVALGVSREKVHVMPMGARTDHIASHSGVEQVPGRIVFAGRLVEKKGVHILLEALAGLDPSLDWSLDIVGDGPLRAELEQQARALTRPVRFLGQLPNAQLAELWHTATLTTFPSMPARSGDQDGLPVALLEAMTTGRAVVATALPGIDEAIVNGDHGVLVPPGDVGALRDAIGRLLADPAERARLGAAAQVRARPYSADAAGERYTALLSSVLASSGSATRVTP